MSVDFNDILYSGLLLTLSAEFNDILYSGLLLIMSAEFNDIYIQDYCCPCL